MEGIYRERERHKGDPGPTQGSAGKLSFTLRALYGEARPLITEPRVIFRELVIE